MSGAPAAASLPGGFSGAAFGAVTTDMTGPLAKTLHKPAYRPLPCGGTNGATLTSNVNAYAAGPDGRVLSAATITSTIATSATTILAEIHSTSTLTGVSLLDGRITAATLAAVSNTVADAGLIHGDADGTSLAELQIDSVPIADNVAPGTALPLPGIGTVTVRSTRIVGGNDTSRRTTVDMLLVTVTEENDFGLPIGSTLAVGHAESAFNRKIGQQALGGAAWVASATGELLEGPGFQAISCAGTGGKTHTWQVSDFGLATIQIANATTTVLATQTATSALARSTATLQSGSLLGGRITFDSMAVVAEDQLNGSTHLRTATGTQFGGLRIDGVAQPALGLRNRRVELPGLGYVIVYDRKIPAATAPGKIKVNGLRVVITMANDLGLAVGAELTVAHADATTQR